MIGRYVKTCAYCDKRFRSDTVHQKYCCDTHRYYAYRERKIENATSKVCPKCFKPWIEPDTSSNKTKPRYCARCQEYFAEHYEKQKTPTERRFL